MTSDFDEFAELREHLGQVIEDGMAGRHYDPNVQATDIPNWLVDRAAHFGLSSGLLLEMVRTFTFEGVNELLDNVELLHGTAEAGDEMLEAMSEAKNAAWRNTWEHLLADVNIEP